MTYILSFIVAFGVTAIAGQILIPALRRLKAGQSIREDGPTWHLSKQGTPTMGGLMFILGIGTAVLTAGWEDLQNGLHNHLVVFLFALVFGAIGFVDDLQKLRHHANEGLTAGQKFLLQLAAAIVFTVLLRGSGYLTPNLYIPFLNVELALPWVVYMVFAAFVMVGTVNAVNLTDGLDGLAIMPTVFVAAGFALVAWATGNMNFANYLHIPYLRHAGELVIVCTAIVGAGLGFLWFNTYPAQVFMGDVGSLALGGALGIIAVLLRQEFLLVIMGGVFVVETLSVILQVGSFKLRGQRIFRMAPIHHHYELKGWPEPRVIVRFWIISLMLVLIGLATLKVR